MRLTIKTKMEFAQNLVVIFIPTAPSAQTTAQNASDASSAITSDSTTTAMKTEAETAPSSMETSNGTTPNLKSANLALFKIAFYVEMMVDVKNARMATSLLSKDLNARPISKTVQLKIM